MLNFNSMIRLAAQAAGDQPIVAAPYALPERLCRDLVGLGIISAYIANGPPDQDFRNSCIAGWWIDRASGAWFIRGAFHQTVIFLSAAPENEVGEAMLLEARLKGIRRLLFVGEDGSLAREIDVAAAPAGLLQSVAIANHVHKINYDDVFREIYTLVGERLRLPAADFVPDRMLIITGSLDVGGAERQAACTAVGLARRFPGRVYLGRARADLHFFEPMVAQGGVRICNMPEQADEFNSPDIIAIREQLQTRYASLGAFNIFYLIFHYALMIQAIKPGLVHTWQEYSNIAGGIAADLVGVPRVVLSGRSVAPDHFSIFQPYMAAGYHALLQKKEVVFLNNSDAGARDYARWLGLERDAFASCTMASSSRIFPAPTALRCEKNSEYRKKRSSLAA